MRFYRKAEAKMKQAKPWYLVPVPGTRYTADKYRYFLVYTYWHQGTVYLVPGTRYQVPVLGAHGKLRYLVQGTEPDTRYTYLVVKHKWDWGPPTALDTSTVPGTR